MTAFAADRRRAARVFAGPISRDELSEVIDVALADASRNHRELALIYLNVREIPSNTDLRSPQVDPLHQADAPEGGPDKPGTDQPGPAASLLRAYAERISARLTRSDTLAHLAGPDLAVLMSSIEHPTDAVTCAHGLIGAFRRPFVTQGVPIRARATAGVAVYPFDGASPSELLDTAEDAARRAAQRASGQRVFSSAELHADKRSSPRASSSRPG